MSFFLRYTWKRNFRIWGVAVVGILVGVHVFLNYPLYQEEKRLQAEKALWLAEEHGPLPRVGNSRAVGIPSLEKVPAVIEICQAVFKDEGVEVLFLNVERIAADPQAQLDFAVLHLHWQGAWSGIERALSRVETLDQLRVRVQEVTLKQGGGEGTIEIYFQGYQPTPGT